jgi:hypothetical protein
VESARRKVDVRLARFTWRSIHTIAASAEEDTQYMFGPPPSLKFAVLMKSFAP